MIEIVLTIVGLVQLVALFVLGKLHDNATKKARTMGCAAGRVIGMSDASVVWYDMLAQLRPDPTILECLERQVRDGEKGRAEVIDQLLRAGVDADLLGLRR